MKIAILLTVYNRKDTTIASLQSLYKAIEQMPSNIKFDIYMVDDGCTDGTSEIVHKLFSKITIIKSSGNLFWSRGMRLAWETAIKSDSYNYYLWFNDDAILYPYALKELFDTLSQSSQKDIICGAFENKNHKVSYGGRNFSHELLTPNGKPQPIYYMNGNLVLISDGPLKKGDMVFYQRVDGQYVMHRIYKVKDKEFYMVGDAQTEIEGPLCDKQIFARITKIRRKGKLIQPRDFWWWFFAKVWIRLVPIRPLIIKMYRLCCRS